MAEGGYMVGWQMNKSESTREGKYCPPTPSPVLSLLPSHVYGHIDCVYIV